MPEPLPGELQAALDASAAARGRFGEPVVFLTETGSTNDVAAGLAERGAPEGAMVVALAQTAGRGRLGRDWFSPAGAGLYVSVVCRHPQVVPVLTLAGGVAVADGIRRATGLPVVITWPNDVVVEAAGPGRRRKIAGVLAEGSTGGGGLQYVVLGFGINLRPAAYPPSIARRATSIEAELGREANAGAVLAETLSVLNGHVSEVANGNPGPLLDRWRRLAPSAVGARIEWSPDGRSRRGVTTGIDEHGALLVRVNDRIERIIAGELTWL